jgi:O-antigen/teichoic acid export membrane protein
MFKRIASDSLVYFIGAFFNQLSGFVVVVLLMRHFSVDLFGMYSYAAAVVMLFTVLADGGIGQYIVKQINSSGVPLPILYRRFQSLQLMISAAILVLLTITAAVFNKPREAGLIWLLGGGPVLSGFLSTAFSFFIAQGARWIIFSRDLIFGLSRLILVGAGIYHNLSLEYFCAIAIAAQLAILVFLIAARNRKSLNYLFTFTKDIGPIVEIARAALPYTLLTLMNVVYNKIDVFMLKRLSNEYEVGVYAGATQFIYPFMFVSSALMSAIYPMLTRNLTVRDAFDKIHAMSTYILGAIGLLMSGFLFLASPVFYDYFFAHKYDAALPIYRILVWYLALVFFYGGYSNTIVAKGGVKFLLALNVVMIAVNVIGNVFAIPLYGAVGAAIVTISCEIIILLILVVYYECFIRHAWTGRTGFFGRGA